MEIGKTTVVLRDKCWEISRKAFLIAVAIWLVTLFMLALAFSGYIFPSDVHWDVWLAKLPKYLAQIDWLHASIRHFDVVALLGMALGFAWYQKRALKLERLILSPNGIQYISPAPPLFKRYKPDWSIAWHQINKAELGTMMSRFYSPDVVFLTFTTTADKRRIIPTHWVGPETYSWPFFQFKSIFKTPSRDEILKSVMASEVVRYLSMCVPQLTLNTNLSQAETYTSLEKNPHGRIATGMIFLLVTYAIIDYVIGPESYIDAHTSLLHIHVSAGLVGATLSAIWLHKSTLVIGEKVGLAILIGLLIYVAMVPGALRINALTDDNGLVAYDYYVTQDTNSVVLRPVVEGMPTIDYFAKNDFWKKFGKDDTYPVQIRKGGLGFYQFNSAIIVDDIHR